MTRSTGAFQFVFSLSHRPPIVLLLKVARAMQDTQTAKAMAEAASKEEITRLSCQVRGSLASALSSISMP